MLFKYTVMLFKYKLKNKIECRGELPTQGGKPYIKK